MCVCVCVCVDVCARCVARILSDNYKTHYRSLPLLYIYMKIPHLPTCHDKYVHCFYRNILLSLPLYIDHHTNHAPCVVSMCVSGGVGVSTYTCVHCTVHTVQTYIDKKHAPNMAT